MKEKLRMLFDEKLWKFLLVGVLNTLVGNGLTDYLEGDLRSGNIYTEIVPLTPDNVQEYLDEGLAW